MATGVKTEIENASIAVVDSDHSPCRPACAKRSCGPISGPRRSSTGPSSDPAWIAESANLVLDIPPRFEADAPARTPARTSAQHRRHGDDPAGVGAGYIEAIIQREALDFLQARGDTAAVPVKAGDRAFFNPNLEGAWFHSVMSVMENITILSILLVGAAVIREREHGTIEHLLVMPVRASEIAFAKIWANGCHPGGG